MLVIVGNLLRVFDVFFGDAAVGVAPVVAKEDRAFGVKALEDFNELADGQRPAALLRAVAVAVALDVDGSHCLLLSAAGGGPCRSGAQMRLVCWLLA